MWNGGGLTHNHSGDERSERVDPARIAASALAAYTAHPPPLDAAYAYSGTVPTLMVATYQSQAMEALRRQQLQYDAYLPERTMPRAPERQGYDNDQSPESDDESDHYNHGEQRGAYSLEPKGKPLALATVIARDSTVEAEAVAMPVFEEGDEAVASPLLSKKRKVPSKKKPLKSPTLPTAAPKKKAVLHTAPSLDDPVASVTEDEYVNIQALMHQFCRVPLLAEFSRPVSLLHPELIPVYSKIVKHPIDLSSVCRGIRRRQYTNTRAIRLDMWRIFSNCIKYHTHPSNKESAVPAFISIALHLRDYFNALWVEYMLPSDPPPPTIGSKQSRLAVLSREAHEKRNKDRAKRAGAIGMTMLSGGFCKKAAIAVETFIENHGRVDQLDTEYLFNVNGGDDPDVVVVKDNLVGLCKLLRKKASDEDDSEYLVDDLDKDVKRCYTDASLFEDSPATKFKVTNRITRLFSKILVPIYEASCRGVNQSSIWGCMAAAIWARESSKKPFWPALVLGILAPPDQREEWHTALTERNESRLPDKLRAELQAGKRKAELALKRQKSGATEQMSFFLVEFMGTHEFIWVKEADIIESFDPEEDPNLASAAGNITKKKRSRISDSKTFIVALEEGKWALEEFELQLSDTCGDLTEEEEEAEEDMNYSYSVLSQSDDEAEEEDGDTEFNDPTSSDAEEANELLSSDGLIDFSAEGRKNAKKRALARKKEKNDAQKKEKADQVKKSKSDGSKSKSESGKAKSEVGKSKPESGKSKTENKTKSDTTKSKPEVMKSKKKSRTSNDARESKRLQKQREKEEKAELRELERKRKKRTKEREKMMKDDLKKKKRKRSDVAEDESVLTNDKRARACAIVTGYITRIAKRDDMKTLGLGGVVNIPTSVVDSSGLLGMTLAFCAAAGEIPMPENGDDDMKIRPWDEIDVDGPKTSAERTNNLEKQLLLLQKKLEQVKESTKKRKLLREETISKLEVAEALIYASEKEAKRLIMRNKGKKTPGKVEPKNRVESVLVVSADASDAPEADSLPEVSADPQDPGEKSHSADIDEYDSDDQAVEEIKADIDESDDDGSDVVAHELDDDEIDEEENAIEVEAEVESEESDEDLLA